MVVCKCKAVTDHWSYAASKAVCVDCVVDQEHEYSFIGSYLGWLDQPYHELICPLSNLKLSNETEVIRLMDYQLYSLSAVCDQKYETKLYSVLPKLDDNSGLANQIRSKLQIVNVNWLNCILETKGKIKSEKKKTSGDVVILMAKENKPVTRRVRSAIKKIQLRKLIQVFIILCILLSICYWIFKAIVYNYSTEKVGSDENLAFLLQNIEKI